MHIYTCNDSYYSICVDSDILLLALFRYFILLKPRSNLNCIAKQEIVSAPLPHTDGMDVTKESNLGKGPEIVVNNS